MEKFGIFWKIWNILEKFGIFWNNFEFFRIFWKYIGNIWNIFEFLSVGAVKLRSLRSILQSPLALWTPIKFFVLFESNFED